MNPVTAGGNDIQRHRDNKCTPLGSKTSSAPLERKSLFFTEALAYQKNPNTGKAPANEFPAAIGPEHFHCYRHVGYFYIFSLCNGWLNNELTDLDTSNKYVRERQAAYLVELLSTAVSGFRVYLA